jgi:uncharacterized protein
MTTNKIHYTYDEIDKICREQTSYANFNFKPDVILAIGGGGLIPARIIRTILNVPIYVVSLSTYDDNYKSIETPRVVQWTNLSKFKDKKILIVDEVDDTRKTLKFLTDKLIIEEELLSKNLGVFVIHNKLKSKEFEIKDLNVSYYKSGKDVEDKWIVYPWD